MRKISFILCALVILSCGNKEPQISSPPDAQNFPIPGNWGSFSVTLADNDYSDSTIEFRGLEALNGRVSCQNVANGPAICTDKSYYPTSQTSAIMSNCTQTTPCYHSVGITVRRGDTSKTIFITVTDTGMSGQIGYR